MNSTIESLARDIELCVRRERRELARRLSGIERKLALGQHVAGEFEKLARAVHEGVAKRAQRERARPVPTFPEELPVAARRDEIARAIREHQVVVVCGETGSGKTTQLPKICLELGRGIDGLIGHTQPRRIAARTLSERIASELETEVGRAVGYKVRFTDRVGADTYIKLMTDGILLAETQHDRLLEQYDTLIVDEAHERSLNIDFLLGYLLRILPERPDLKVIVTSATIDPERLSRHFGDAPILEISGRTYPVSVRYSPPTSRAPEELEQDDEDEDDAIVRAVHELSGEATGDILVFLPTERAIRETAQTLERENLRDTEILPLYARLASGEQSRVFQPHRRRRIVLATNVAETSLTVPGIKYVIDSGLARISRYDVRRRVQRLPIERISQASARQRAGRCGRTSAGICIRLYSEEDFLDRPDFTPPEIVRTNLTSVILQMASLGLGLIDDFPFIDPPDRRAIRDGYDALQELGAIDGEYRLTPLGKQLARLPADPRIARMIVAGHELNCLAPVLIVAAALSVQDPRDRPQDAKQKADEAHRRFAGENSDFSSFINLFRAYREQAESLSKGKLRAWCEAHFVSFTRMREWLDIHAQLEETAKELGFRPSGPQGDDAAVHRALLTGLLRNVAVKCEDGTYLGARNVKLNLFPGSVLAKKRPEFIMVAEIVETDRLYGRIAAKILPEWIEPLAEHVVGRSYFEPHWERARGRVSAYVRVTLFGLTIVAKRKVDYARFDPEAAREIFIRTALVEGEFDTRGSFFAHNRAIVEKVEALAHKTRRRDLVVDDQAVYAFFDARLPPHVFSTPSFEHWRKQAEQTNPSILHLEVSDVVSEDLSQFEGESYPTELHRTGPPLALRYRFEPGEADDGVTAVVPLALLHRLDPQIFEWLVPGLLTAKIAALLESLPKATRRTLVPVWDFATRCRDAIEKPAGSLTARLSEALASVAKLHVPASAFRLELVPEHHNMRFEVLDEGGKVLAASRDLAALKAQFVAQSRGAFAAISKGDFERERITKWDLGTLPEQIDIDYAKGVLPGYPALVAEAGTVALRVFDDRERAEASHRRGLVQLYRLRLSDVVNQVIRSLPGFSKLCLQYALLGNATDLGESLVARAIEATCVGRELARSEEAFERGAREGRGKIAAAANEAARVTGEVLDAYQLVLKRLGTVKPGSNEAELKAHLERLVYPGFLSRTPSGAFSRLARYVKAVELRLERLRNDPVKQRERAAQMAALFGEYERRKQENAKRGVISSELESYRWLLEEFHVSLFAQELKSPEPISAKRLAEVWSRVPG